MKKYRVVVTETEKRVFEIEASSKEEATAVFERTDISDLDEVEGMLNRSVESIEESK